MALRMRRRVNRRVNPNKPIHSLNTLFDEEDDPNPYPFDKNMGKLKEYPKHIDILHLLHDIHALNESNVVDQYLLEKIKIEISNTKISFISHLADFVQFAVKKIIKNYYYGPFSSSQQTDIDGPNWMLLLYHNKLFNTNIYQKLNIISPILSLCHIDSFYDIDDDDVITLISSLIVIRQYVPHSVLKGIDHNNDDDDDNDNDKDIKYYIDYNQLFGAKLVPFLLLDLVKYITTFLDIKSFFKCSMINHCWLNFIYRNDTFLSIYKQIISENKHLKCKLLDHSILSQVHIPTAPITIGWTLQCHNNSYLDFITTRNHWFQEYIDIITITLQQKQQQTQQEQDKQIWIDIVETTKSSNEIGFDSIFIKNKAFQFDANSVYRVKLDILKPFKSMSIYSNITKLDPIQWMLRYNESKARDDDMDKFNNNNNNNNNRKLFHVHKFWFEYYMELLHSLNTNVISDVLKNLRICQNRIRCDAQYLSQQCTSSLFKTIIRYVLHENNKIKLNAMRCLRRIAIQDIAEMQDYYLMELADNGLIKICETMLIKISDNENNTICSIREQMLWFLGYYIKTGCKWKSILLKEMEITKFLQFTIDEIKLNRDPKYTASYIWFLSKFFSLYHQTREDDKQCGNDKIINTNLGKTSVELMWNCFNLSFNKYRKLKLQQTADRREAQMMEIEDDEDVKEREVERQKEIDGLLSVVRDSYYAYSMILRYFNKEIVEIIDMEMLKNIINGFELAIDGMDYEFALRMVRTSLSMCIDTIFRLNIYNKEIFKIGYIDKLFAILDAIIAKLKFLIMIKEKNIDIKLFNMEHEMDGNDEKPKQDQFMILFSPLLEAIPIIGNNLNYLENAQIKLTKLLYQIIDVATLYNDYLNVTDFSNESKEDISDRKSDLQDLHCCTMSVIWDMMTRYGQSIREYILNNTKIMDLIQYKWAIDDNMVTSNQAQSLLSVLKNDKAFNQMFKDNKNNDNNGNNDDNMDGNNIVCPCGDYLQLIEAKDCYPPRSTYCYLYCDYCREKIDWGLNPNRMVYHCDKKENSHPHGFDLCLNCGKRKFIIDNNK